MRPLDELLQKTSRTFAISIPLLPDELRHSVSVAYLLFRIADTIEDELPCSLKDRRRALLTIADRFADEPTVVCDALGEMRIDMQSLSNSGYSDLLRNAHNLIEDFLSLSVEERTAIASHLVRTCRGMAHYLGRDLSTGTVQNLREYCYIVAGIVGEMLTELFILHDPHLAPSRDQLLREAVAFGEGLQLVNIIRDASDDLHAGRCYLPRSLGRSQLIDFARSNLQRAQGYILLLQDGNCHPGTIQFNALNLALAFATIDAVQAHGPGAKLNRVKVSIILDHIKNGQFFPVH